MKIIKIILLVIVSILLFISLFFGNIFLTLGMSLEYSSIEPKIKDLAKDIISEKSNFKKSLDRVLPYMKKSCQPHESINYSGLKIPCSEIEKGKEETSSFIASKHKHLTNEKAEISLSDKKYNYMKKYCKPQEKLNMSGSSISRQNIAIPNIPNEIPCSKIEKGREEVISYGVSEMTKKVYYKEYNCGFWNCFKETSSPFFLVSEKARNYWYSNFYISLMISLILAGLSVFLVKNKNRAGYIIGGILVGSSLILVTPDILSSFLTNIITSATSLPGIASNYISNILSLFFSKATTIFTIVSTLGVVLIIAGFVMRFFWKKK